MTIKIQNQLQTSTILESGTTKVNNTAPEVFFSRNNWNLIKPPNWQTNEAPQREGDFKHYNGRSDGTLNVVVYLYGSNRNANLLSLQNAQDSPIYLDADDVDSNVSGKYILRSVIPNKQEKMKLITTNLFLEEYNN